jgi:hypothetical protein
MARITTTYKPLEIQSRMYLFVSGPLFFSFKSNVEIFEFEKQALRQKYLAC